MSLHTITIDFDDMQLDVTLDYSPYEAPSCDSPGQPESWDIVSVSSDGDDYAASERDLVRIKKLAIEAAETRDDDGPWIHPTYARYEAIREAIEWAGGPVVRA